MNTLQHTLCYSFYLGYFIDAIAVEGKLSQTFPVLVYFWRNLGEIGVRAIKGFHGDLSKPYTGQQKFAHGWLRNEISIDCFLFLV